MRVIVRRTPPLSPPQQGTPGMDDSTKEVLKPQLNSHQSSMPAKENSLPRQRTVSAVGGGDGDSISSDGLFPTMSSARKRNSIDIRHWNRIVKVRMNVFDVNDIDIPGHSFTSDFFLEVAWDDMPASKSSSPQIGAPSLDMDRDAISPISADMEDEDDDAMPFESMFPYKRSRHPRRWTPRLNFSNLVKELRDREEWVIVYKNERGSNGDAQPKRLQYPRVCYRTRVKAKFQERFELQAFPLDAQDLQIEIVSMRHQIKHKPFGMKLTSTGGDEVELVGNSDISRPFVVPTTTFLLKEEYWLSSNMHVESIFQDPIMSSSGLKYPKLVMSMKVTRRSEFHLFYIALPMFLIVALSFPVSLLPVSDLTGRLGLLLTLLLSAITYTSLLRDHLPKVSYLTLLDKYVLFCNFLLAASAAESSLIFFATKRKWDLLAKNDIEDIEDRFIGLLSFLWVLLHVGVSLLRKKFSVGALTELERNHGCKLYRANSSTDDGGPLSPKASNAKPRNLGGVASIAVAFRASVAVALFAIALLYYYNNSNVRQTD